MPHARNAPKDAVGVPVVLQLQEPRVVGAPEGGLPIGLGRIGLIDVGAGIRSEVAQSLDLDFAEMGGCGYLFRLVQGGPRSRKD